MVGSAETPPSHFALHPIPSPPGTAHSEKDAVISHCPRPVPLSMSRAFVFLLTAKPWFGAVLILLSGILNIPY